MKCFHGTDKWDDIKREGVLWGVRNAPSRCTYLTPDIDEAKSYGNVVLEVEFDPEIDVPNNWLDGAWQFRVYAPIPISRVNMLKRSI